LIQKKYNSIKPLCWYYKSISIYSNKNRRKRLMGGLTECSFLHILDMHAGALGAEVTRQSIPNLAVKLYSGDNTVGGALWENSSAPAANYATITEKICYVIIDHSKYKNTNVYYWV
jgi:hypothetical protein